MRKFLNNAEHSKVTIEIYGALSIQNFSYQMDLRKPSLIYLNIFEEWRISNVNRFFILTLKITIELLN